jgi:hypothetical protein
MSASDAKEEKTENPTLGVLEEDDEFEEFAVAGIPLLVLSTLCAQLYLY